ncbi:MAG: hypothetical protein ACYC7E_00125 [Armatimonadota bacterium]
MRRLSSTFLGLLAGLLFLCLPVLAKPVILGLLSHDAEKYNVEFQQFDRMIPVYKAEGITPTLAPSEPFMSETVNSEQLYKALKPYHAIVLATTSESHLTVRLTPEVQDMGRRVGAALERYVRDGGGLFVQAQAVRYPNTDDEKYWNVVLAPLGIEILHEGCYDPTREYAGYDLGKTTYWFTQNIQPHPVTEGVKRLYLPEFGPGPYPGLVAIRYSPEWKVVVAGEHEAKSCQSDTDNNFDRNAAGTYTSSPPVVAVRELGKGRIVSFPISPIHTGMNYTNPLWKNTFESDGDKGSGFLSNGMKLLTNCYKWIAQPALDLPEYGTYVSKPYAPAKYPQKVDWDQLKFNTPDGGVANYAYPDGQTPDFAQAGNSIRGIVGARSNYAGGKGTVAEYVKAAKAAGLSFIVFNDPLELLTAEKLERLKKDCAAASDANFYACPGIEFTDGPGNRWAFWGEKVIFPTATFNDGKRDFPLWDGKHVLEYGYYIAACAYCPSALLDYRQLAENKVHRENLWWFYDYLPFVYEKDKLIADNYNEFLFGLRDLRWAMVASYTRISDPADVTTAMRTCYTGFKDLQSAREGLNTRCGGYSPSRRQYTSQGPIVAAWEAINPQLEHNWKYTRGAQRVRLKFVVRSDIGIADVKVHDADTGIIRRFAGNGAKELAREMEIVNDRQHYVTLEVTDTAGKRAVSWYILVFCYKQGLFRCGDNLNILGATGLIWHPDRNEMMPLAKQWENGMDLSIRGWDSGGYLCPMPRTWAIDTIRTDRGYYPEFRKDGMVGKILDMSLSSYNLQIATQQMTMLSEAYDTTERPTPALASLPRDKGPLDFFQRTHTIYAPMTRTDWFTAWNYRRPREGMKDYRGGLMWHEGEIKFTKDVTLKGKVPIPLVRMNCPVDLEKGWGNALIVKEGEGLQTRVALLRDPKVATRISGTLRAGGYASQMPSGVGYEGFLVPAGFEYSYDASLPGSIEIGLGTEGQMVKAGTVFRYKFAFGSFADMKGAGNGLLEETTTTLNMAGGKDGYPVAMKAGKFVDGTFYFTAQAAKNEALFTLGPRPLIIDLPIRVRGLQDNGCAAVYSTLRPWFRFVPVVGDTAYFQEPMEKANELWVGNIFVCDNKAVKISVVVDGQADGKKPFIEVHNPTERDINARVSSPAHTPLFGGAMAMVRIPAGDSVRLEISGKMLTQK